MAPSCLIHPALSHTQKEYGSLYPIVPLLSTNSLMLAGCPVSFSKFSIYKLSFLIHILHVLSLDFSCIELQNLLYYP